MICYLAKHWSRTRPVSLVARSMDGIGPVIEPFKPSSWKYSNHKKEYFNYLAARNKKISPAIGS